MIAYFDTSAIVPLLIQEAGTDASGRLWDVADRVVTSRVAHVEARAALAHAARLHRIRSRQLQRAKTELDDLFAQLDLVEMDSDLIERAGDLAEAQRLRAYDAVHLAAALGLGTDETILVAGDSALLAAATASGLLVAGTA